MSKQSAFGKPQTLWELCEQTVEAILTQPLNYYQDDYAHSAETCMVDENDRPLKGACGTAYCRAGWMGTILGIHPSQLARIPKALLESAGVDPQIVNQLFAAIGMPTAVRYQEGFHTLDNSRVCGFDERSPGTTAYVRAGAAGLKKFMRQHKKKLKAARLVKNADGDWSVKNAA